MENEIKSLLRSFSVDVAVITRSDAMMIRINAKLRDRMPSVGGNLMFSTLGENFLTRIQIVDLTLRIMLMVIACARARVNSEST